MKKKADESVGNTEYRETYIILYSSHTMDMQKPDKTSFSVFCD